MCAARLVGGLFHLRWLNMRSSWAAFRACIIVACFGFLVSAGKKPKLKIVKQATVKAVPKLKAKVRNAPDADSPISAKAELQELCALRLAETGITSTTTLRCRTKHHESKYSQMGTGFCKACLHKFYPETYKRTQVDRMSPCSICKKRADIAKRGLCKRCFSLRTCHSCENINDDDKARMCPVCPVYEKTQAKSVRLAMWCEACTTPAERALGVCHECQFVDHRCHHCEKGHAPSAGLQRCCACHASLRFCSACIGIVSMSQSKGLLCKACWGEQGRLCIACGVKPAQKPFLPFFRTCFGCRAVWFCSECKLPPSGDTRIQSCRMCPNLAMWCPLHWTAEQLQSKLCERHYKTDVLQCTYCMGDVGMACETWYGCSTTDCPRQIHACTACVESLTPERLRCDLCFSSSGRVCISCREEPARTDRKFARCCRPCFGKHFPAKAAMCVRAESDAYLARISKQQEWDGTEPALQLLLIPLSDTDENRLPEYSKEPHYLSPHHCRLCLQTYDPGGEEEHMRTCHDCNKGEYRNLVFRRTLAEWPQRITPQVLRTRLAAFKSELCDFNFKELPCAACCRLKRMCKLTSVTFPAIDADGPPAWLPWSREEWHVHRKGWYEGVDNILNADRYLDRFFHTADKCHEAETNLHAMRKEGCCPLDFKSVAAAESWLRRVETWRAQLRTDLYADCVPAPGAPEHRWLLYRSAELHEDAGSGAVSCSLCKCCRQAFSGIVAKTRAPDVRMPDVARANGLWRGPDPEQLTILSYTEAKVINLARVYVSVKRVFLDRGSYAGTSASEAPLYHQKNVVAYPQDPDTILACLGQSPAALASTIHVQFVGEGREGLRYHRDLQVSVERLRSAFRWLSVNSWHFMNATRHHEYWDSEALDHQLEDLLALYEKSLGGNSVPAEIIQGAARLDPRHSGVNAAGPADCLPRDDGEADDDETVRGPGAVDIGDADNCAGALDGGVDSITPIQIWDDVMRKYKVAQVSTPN